MDKELLAEVDAEVEDAADEHEADMDTEDDKNTAGTGIRKFFGAGTSTRGAASPGAVVDASQKSIAHVVPPSQGTVHAAPAVQQSQPSLVLSAFNLSLSACQDAPTNMLEPCAVLADGQLEKAILAGPVTMPDVKDMVPLLIASAPLLPSGTAIFARLPEKWINMSGRSDALGTRCLFASRRHEHSVFEPLQVDCLLRVPPAAREWQPLLQVPADFLRSHGGGASLASEEPWSVDMHPGRRELRVAVRPGVILARMLRRGTALPAAAFTWRVVDSNREPQQKSLVVHRGLAADVGEFSILCNVEDAAHTQPPRFLEFPLRIEQLRSLGWMIMQERRRREVFVTELREAIPCPDAAHWFVEGSLRCEYRDVKGGVLADAIGYGKTACTIGLIDCTSQDPVPEVPLAFKGFIPSRATLVLAPTNLHAQWLAEIKKFTGDALKVISVPTCAQLKKLPAKELIEADVVVATYRLFYSTPYLHRLQELARGRRPEFAFPRQSQSSYSSEWAKAYREAFESLPAWAAALQGLREEEPVTPAKLKRAVNADEVTPEAQSSQASQSRRRLRSKQKAAECVESSVCSQEVPPVSQASMPAKRRRVSVEAGAEWTLSANYIPLEAFWWKRVVCDEFHELLSRYPPAQVAVELFHADYKWGLSGTPPCQTLAQIRKAAGFLGVQIPSPSSTDDTGEAPRKVAQEWLDAFARRNTAELPTLQEEECIIPVRLTPKERALYAALTEQPQMEASKNAAVSTEPSIGLEEPPEIQAARRNTSGLLKLCSHFCPSGASEVLSAEDECERQLALRREQVQSVERELRTHIDRAVATVQLVRHFEPHYCRAPDRDGNYQIYGFLEKESRACIAARLRFLAAPTNGSKAQLLARLFEVLSSSSIHEEAKEMALRADFDLKALGPAAKLKEKPPPAWKTLEALVDTMPVEESPAVGRTMVSRIVKSSLTTMSEGVSGIPQRCARLRSNQGMPRWPGSINQGTPASAQKRSDLEQANWDWLADPENAKNLRSVITAWKLDIERNASKVMELEAAADAKLQNLRSFSETLQASQAPLVVSAAVVPIETPGSRFAKYGSKIETLVKHVLKLQDGDLECKLICFVQWEDLKRKIGAALTEFGIEHLTLEGSVWKRRAALMRFQYEAESPRMLLLSLEESASGTNLTAANHVLIVHPMEAATRDEAVAFEMQAVGRVRRPGQQRKIHIWRFVTVDTIEQIITEEHQKELWERQHAAVQFSQAVMESQHMNLVAFEEDPEEGVDTLEMNAGMDTSTQLYTAHHIEPCAQEQFPAQEHEPQDLATQPYAQDQCFLTPAPTDARPAQADEEMVDPEAETLCFFPLGASDDLCTQPYAAH
jgi:SNF2 family DNA or RNA helicase